MILFAKDYILRSDLEAVIRAKLGDDLATNRVSHQIRGTRAELQNLSLDDTVTVFGVPCVITDLPTEDIVKAKKPK